MSKIIVNENSITIIPPDIKNDNLAHISLSKEKLMKDPQIKNFIENGSLPSNDQASPRKFTEYEINRILTDMGLRKSNFHMSFDDFIDSHVPFAIYDPEFAHKKRKETLYELVPNHEMIKDRFYGDFSKFIEDLKEDIDDLVDFKDDFMSSDGFIEMSYKPIGLYTDFSGVIGEGEGDTKNYTKSLYDSNFILNFTGSTMKEFRIAMANQLYLKHGDSPFRLSNFISIIMESNVIFYRSYSAKKHNVIDDQLRSFVRYTYVFKKGDFD